MNRGRPSIAQALIGHRSRVAGTGYLNVTPEEADALRSLLNHHSDEPLSVPQSELERLRLGIDELLGPGATTRLCNGSTRVRVFADINELRALGLQRFS